MSWAICQKMHWHISSDLPKTPKHDRSFNSSILWTHSTRIPSSLNIQQHFSCFSSKCWYFRNYRWRHWHVLNFRLIKPPFVAWGCVILTSGAFKPDRGENNILFSVSNGCPISFGCYTDHTIKENDHQCCTLHLLLHFSFLYSLPLSITLWVESHPPLSFSIVTHLIAAAAGPV